MFIFSRYLCPGECCIHDRGGEFCNKVMHCLMEDFGVEIRVIKAGRPMANGQGESAVKNVKNKVMLLCLENGNEKKNKLSFLFSGWGKHVKFPVDR